MTPSPTNGRDNMMTRVGAYAWALPTTALGLALVAIALATGARASVVGGVVEAHGGMLDPMLRRFVPLRGGASAMTLGHVVVARDEGALVRTRAHERAHRHARDVLPVLFRRLCAAALHRARGTR